MKSREISKRDLVTHNKQTATGKEHFLFPCEVPSYNVVRARQWQKQELLIDVTITLT